MIMRKILISFFEILASPWTHIIIGFFALVFTWCLAYENGYSLDAVSFVAGVFGSAGISCIDLGIQKLRCRKNKDK